jgi:hypothetical protein
MDLSILKRPSAYLPIILSLASLALVFGYIALYGTHPDPTPHDEEPAARIWQLLMLAQVFGIGFFLLKWTPRQPRESLVVIVIQVIAFLAAWSPVFLIGL